MSPNLIEIVLDPNGTDNWIEIKKNKNKKKGTYKVTKLVGPR